VKDDGEEGVDCGDVCSKECEEICDHNGVCDINLVEEFGFSENENYVNCADCFCGDGVCDDIEKEDDSCPNDCVKEEPSEFVDSYEEDEGVSFWWLFFIFIILLILGFGGYYYIKYYKPKKKGGKKREFKFLRESKSVKEDKGNRREERISGFRMPFVKREKSPLDEEIDKSIKEARKLIGRK
jgi:hypothetical protein